MDPKSPVAKDHGRKDKEEHVSPTDPGPTVPISNGPGPPPDGGLRAWLQVVGAFFLMFNTWGNVQSFGAYQTYWETGELFQASSSSISWLGALQGFFLNFLGSLTGPLYDAGHFRVLTTVGATMIILGTMMLSLVTKYWQALLAQAFCTGIGASCLFVPSVAILSTYFSTKMGLAVGLASSGSAAGGIVYSAVFHRLQPNIGFAWTVRTIGFIQLVTLVLSLSLLRVRVLPPAKRKLVDWSAFREPAWVVYVLGSIPGLMGFYVPFFYIQYFAIARGIESPQFAFYLLSMANAGAFFGRIVPNFVSDKIGPVNTSIPIMTVTGILSLTLLAVDDTAGIVIFCVFYGFFSAPYLSLPGPTIVKLCPSPQVIGTRMGMSFGIVSFGFLLGTPIAGAIVGRRNFDGIWIFSGVCALVCAVAYTIMRVLLGGWKIRNKVQLIG